MNLAAGPIAGFLRHSGRSAAKTRNPAAPKAKPIRPKRFTDRIRDRFALTRAAGSPICAASGLPEDDDIIDRQEAVALLPCDTHLALHARLLRLSPRTTFHRPWPRLFRRRAIGGLSADDPAVPQRPRRRRGRAGGAERRRVDRRLRPVRPPARPARPHRHALSRASVPPLQSRPGRRARLPGGADEGNASNSRAPRARR